MYIENMSRYASRKLFQAKIYTRWCFYKSNRCNTVRKYKTAKKILFLISQHWKLILVMFLGFLWAIRGKFMCLDVENVWWTKTLIFFNEVMTTQDSFNLFLCLTEEYWSLKTKPVFFFMLYILSRDLSHSKIYYFIFFTLKSNTVL